MRLTPVGCLAFAVLLQAQSGSSVFPMEKGTSWIYTGSLKSGQGETQLSWKAEVLDSVQSGRFKVALLLGDPRDLAAYGELADRGCYLLTVVDQREVYLHPLPAQCVLPHDRFSDLMVPEELFLRLRDNKRHSYAGRKTVYLSDIEGVPRNRPFTAYVVVHQTLPDHEIVTYVPGIGLTNYEYVHHGTVSEVHMRLVKFRRAP